MAQRALGDQRRPPLFLAIRNDAASAVASVRSDYPVPNPDGRGARGRGLARTGGWGETTSSRRASVHHRLMKRGFLLLAVIAVVVAGCSSSDERTDNGLRARVLAEVGDGFDQVSAGPDRLIALGGGDGYRIDPSTGAPTGGEIDLPAVHTRRAVAADGAIWFTSSEVDSSGMRVSPTGGQTELVMPADWDGVGVAVSGERGWMFAPAERKAVPFTQDGAAGEPIDVPCDLVPVTDPLPGGDDAVWAYCEEGVARIDTSAGTATLVDIGGRPTGLALTDSALWAARDGKLYAIDMRSGEVTATVDRPNANRLAGSGDDLWVTGGGITLHSASDGSQLAGPVGMPEIDDQVGTGIKEMAAFDGRLFVTTTFYGTPLVMVERTS